MTLLTMNGVRKSFPAGKRGVVHAVNGVSIDIAAGETVALIGESGSGKSTVARLALRLHEPDSGSVVFDGADLATLSREELRRLRAKMTIVFQEPFESLDPRQRIGAAVEEPLRLHKPSLGREERQAHVLGALAHVAIPPELYHRLPHELSGGQQQRVGIARALVTRPKFVVLDEPTSSLDLSVRAQILDLLAALRVEFGLAYLFVSHDIHTVEYIADRIFVMYLGRIVEQGPTAEVFADPKHPYTQALLSSTLSPDPQVKRDRFLLGGEIPSPTELPSGCVLLGRCPLGEERCGAEPVPLHRWAGSHEVACIKVGVKSSPKRASVDSLS